MVIASGNVIMYILMKRKFESLNIIQTHNQSESVVAVHTYYRIETNNINIKKTSNKRSMKYIYDVIKLDIY